MRENIFKITTNGKTYNLSVHHRAASKDILVFLHGLGCSKENFRHVWDHKEFKEFSLLTVDFLGFGKSDKPEKFSYTMEDQAAICANLLERFSEHRRHIIAHSMGGGVGLLLPEKILGSISSFANLEGNLISQDCFISRKVSNMSFAEFQEKLLPKLKARLSEDKIQLADLENSFPLAYYKSCESLVFWSDSGNLLSAFKNLECPKAYFYGDRNAGIEPLKQIENIMRVEVEKSGHMMMLDNPDDFYLKLKRFLLSL